MREAYHPLHIWAIHSHPRNTQPLVLKHNEGELPVLPQNYLKQQQQNPIPILIATLPLSFSESAQRRGEQSLKGNSASLRNCWLKVEVSFILLSQEDAEALETESWLT